MGAWLTSPIERTRFFRLAIVGAIGAIIDFAVMNALVNLFSVPLVFAGTVSFIVAVISNFTWNRYWTYPDSRSKPIFRQLIEFSLVSIGGLIIRIPTLALLEPLIFKMLSTYVSAFLPSTSLPTDVISDNLTLGITILIVLFWNFFINRYWTYRDVDKAGKDPPTHQYYH